VFDGRQQVSMEDMIKSILRIIFHAPEKTRGAEVGLQHVACHEAGHALMSELLEPNSVNLVTVLAHDSNITGLTSYHRDDNYFFSKALMEKRVMCLLAGKAATEVCYGVVDTGSSSDLRRVFDIVRRFVSDYCSYGFEKFAYERTPSNGVLDRRDAQVATEVAHYYDKVRQLLVENRDKLEALADRLLEEKTLLGFQVQKILKSA
jgi:cell division protease FtsH